MTCERTYIATAVAALEEQSHPTWHPDRDEQLGAIEILLASKISTELRRALREREVELVTRRAA